MERIKLSDLTLVRDEGQIPGNFTSVMGEYSIPQIKKTGFYKMNGCMIGAENEDLRELLSTRIMDKIGFPHADILLACNDQNENGCLSVNILNENEHFVEPEQGETSYRPINNINDFIESDLEQISTIPNITSEDLRERKEYLLKYLLVSAVINNTDIKMDNMFMIRNSATGEFRNPEYYDMGVAFIDTDSRMFFTKFSAEQIIEQLYELYPSQIVSYGKNIQQNLKKEDVQQILMEDSFEEFSEPSRESIIELLSERLDLIGKLNSKEKNNFTYGTNSLHEVTKDTDLSLRDKAKSVLARFKDRIKGRDIDE